MRIIGGTARGHNLKTPQGKDIRPTGDKVRLAIFNALFSRGGVVGKTILDAFCGTGALGLEALSQGAEYCYFFDIAKTSLHLAKENATMLGMDGRAEFFLSDATHLPPKASDKKSADIIFLDPPYRKDLIISAVHSLASGGWLSRDSILVIESEESADLCGISREIMFDKNYGETRVRFLKYHA